MLKGQSKILIITIGRRISLILVVAVMFLTNCSINDETQFSHLIGFKAVSLTSQPSKAYVYGEIGANYSDDESFGVYAFHNVDGVWDKKPYMNNVEILKSSDEWMPIDTAYSWPGLGDLTFACFSPYYFGEGGVAANEQIGISITGFIADTDNNCQIDLMSSDISRKFIYDGNPVPIVFKHILSKICFTVCTKDNYIGSNIDSIIINHITIRNLKTKADYNVSDSASWSNHSRVAEYRVLDSDYSVYLDKTVSTIARPLLVIPQDASNYKWNTDEDIVEIRYTTVFDNGTRDYQVKTFGTQTKWEKGRIYKYNISIGQSEILFDPESSEWNVLIE